MHALRSKVLQAINRWQNDPLVRPSQVSAQPAYAARPHLALDLARGAHPLLDRALDAVAAVVPAEIGVQYCAAFNCFIAFSFFSLFVDFFAHKYFGGWCGAGKKRGAAEKAKKTAQKQD